MIDGNAFVHRIRSLFKLGAALGVVLLATSVQAGGAPDPHKTMGPEECAECHENEARSWKQTHHHKTYRKMPRTKEARKIRKAMGLRRIKRDSDCLSCHFTSTIERDKPKPIAGISCESCHSAAKEWMDPHSDFGGKDVKPEDETPAHRKKRLAKVDAMGMIRPDHLYKLASNCMECHTVPNEELVNKGGHPAGSDFELVSWSQGEVRHNYARSESGDDNVESSPERKRMMFVVGLAVDLEYSLRGVAQATQKADYAVKMAHRVARTMKKLKTVNEAQSLPEVEQMIKVADEADLKLNNEAQLSRAADDVAELARKFLADHDGSELAALDGLIPSDYKGDALQ